MRNVINTLTLLIIVPFLVVGGLPASSAAAASGDSKTEQAPVSNAEAADGGILSAISTFIIDAANKIVDLVCSLAQSIFFSASDSDDEEESSIFEFDYQPLMRGVVGSFLSVHFRILQDRFSLTSLFNESGRPG